MTKLAAEVGGTFTDLVWIDENGRVATHKVASTPEDPSIGVIRGMDEAMTAKLPRASQLFHGSTVATNAVLERKGCRTAFLTTRGFRDLLVLQRQLRPNVYAVVCKKAEPIVPLSRTIEVTERMSEAGEVLVPLDEREALASVERLVDTEAPEALAVCLLHAYQNPSHEKRVSALIKERYPDLRVVLSSDVLPTFREYERASTTAIAAYLTPLVDRYLENLEHDVRKRSEGASLFIMQSSGGVLPSHGARAQAAEMLNSGPAAGVIGAERVAELLDDPDFITLDVGGTSADVCLVPNGHPEVTSERDIDGLPVAVPSVDIANVGAGGGSIGWIDRGGMLQVGPHSAGARPGPACYAHGGEEPTVTDALVHLGWIRPSRFLGGRMPLSSELAERALQTLAKSLDRDAAEIAHAMVDVSAAHVSRAVRLVSVQRGYDPKGYVLYGYGGMGPALSARVASDLGISRVVVPPCPGLFSSLGLLVADLKRVYRETGFDTVTSDVSARIHAAFDPMRQTACAELEGYGARRDDIEWAHYLEMRYRGQGFELLALLDMDRLRNEGRPYLLDLFKTTHRARYGSAAPSDDIEVVTYRLVAKVPGSRDVLDRLHASAQAESSREAEEGSVLDGGKRHPCRFVWRDSLSVGDSLCGLTIIEEPTATTVVPPGWQATLAEAGALVLEKVEDA